MSSPASPSSFFQVGGTLEPNDPSYVERPADSELLESVLKGEYCNLLAARQMGKSSLMIRTVRRLIKQHVHAIVVDLSGIGASSTDAQQWYAGILRLIRQEMVLEVDELAWWRAQPKLSPVQRFDRFVREQILDKSETRIAIFVDEIDTTLPLSFTDDFFAAIRAMYNKRASEPDYQRLTFVLVGVARPADLIKDRRKTPYNIGHTIDLEDFDAQSARKLLPGLESAYPGQAEGILNRVLYWTGGHPYLTQCLCRAIVESQVDVWPEQQIDRLDEQIDRLVESLFLQEGQIRRESNLQRIDEYVGGSEHREQMLRIYGDILADKPVEDEQRSIEKSQLKLSGLVKTSPAGLLCVRNRIYQRVFGPQWAGVLQPAPDLAPQRAGAPQPAPGPTPQPRTRPWWPKVVVPLALFALLLGIGWPLYNGQWRWIQPITPTVIVKAPTLTLTSTLTVTPADTQTRAPADTPTTRPSATPTATATWTVAPPTATRAPTQTATATTPASATADTPTAVPPTTTYTPTPTQVPLIRLPNPKITALRSASIFASPDPGSKELGIIDLGEQITVLGQAVSPWDNWLYVFQERADVAGYAWYPYFEWSPLELVDVAPNAFCSPQGDKRAGLRVIVRGGDGRYTFYWGAQVIPTIESEGGDNYLVHWPWGTWPQADTFSVTSGDGEERTWSQDLFVREPSCSP